jgi:hypothetical protein
MILQQGEYKIQDDGIWIKKSELEAWRKHYSKIAGSGEHKRTRYLLGKITVLTDLLKMFDDLEIE